jgi:hypothetical protein
MYVATTGCEAVGAFERPRADRHDVALDRGGARLRPARPVVARGEQRAEPGLTIKVFRSRERGPILQPVERPRVGEDGAARQRAVAS